MQRTQILNYRYAQPGTGVCDVTLWIWKEGEGKYSYAKQLGGTGESMALERLVRTGESMPLERLVPTAVVGLDSVRPLAPGHFAQIDDACLAGSYIKGTPWEDWGPPRSASPVFCCARQKSSMLSACSLIRT